MSNDIYDKPTTSIDPFKNVSKEVITDRNELVLQQFLKKQEDKKKGIKDEADILINIPLGVGITADTYSTHPYPEFIIDGNSNET